MFPPSTSVLHVALPLRCHDEGRAEWQCHRLAESRVASDYKYIFIDHTTIVYNETHNEFPAQDWILGGGGVFGYDM